MLRRERLQHGKALYWNDAEFCILIENITLQQFKNCLFIYHMFISLENNCAGKPHAMFVSQHNKFNCKCKRDYKEICQLLSEQVHSPYVSDFNSSYMDDIEIENFNKLKPSTYIWHNFILICQIKLISMIALLRHIFVSFFNAFLQKGS